MQRRTKPDAAPAESRVRADEREPSGSSAEMWSETFAKEYESDNKTLKTALVLAALLHGALLAANLPVLEDKPPPIQEERKPYVVQEVRFKPPPPPEKEEPPPPPKKAEPEPAPKPETKKVPIPDPTPDEPEPVREPLKPIPIPEPREIAEPQPVREIEPVPMMEAPDVDTVEIPEPPPPPPPPEPEGPIRVGGDVKAPVKVHAPNPPYPEAARKARVQGVVVVEAVIDKQGRVKSVKVVKGLPMGLDKMAADTVKTWRFKPGTRQGQPVEVLYNLTVNFTIQ
ncbi:MAG TPA: TonB family protein [Thermoanaerobaculia bacterium]|nr:TonB family protein [Thermoanaerobaculia bacterium]